MSNGVHDSSLRPCCQGCVEYWKNTVSDGSSIWDRISRHKAPVVEPRESAAFPRAAEEFKANLDNPNTSGVASSAASFKRSTFIAGHSC
eukprot:scaffold6545_cov31-Prasinocladus_malaysianus.AAC.2